MANEQNLNRGGRPKGSLNKKTAVGIEKLMELVTNQWPDFIDTINQLRDTDPEGYMKYMWNLIKHTIPAVQPKLDADDMPEVEPDMADDFEAPTDTD